MRAVMILMTAMLAATPAVPPPAVIPVLRPPAPRIAEPLPPPPPQRGQVLAAVRAEWPTYDVRRQGRLGPLEFGTWVMHANGAAVQAPGAVKGSAGVKPITAMNATARAFAKADANHDGGVTPDEMAAFLTR